MQISNEIPPAVFFRLIHEQIIDVSKLKIEAEDDYGNETRFKRIYRRAIRLGISFNASIKELAHLAELVSLQSGKGTKKKLFN